MRSEPRVKIDNATNGGTRHAQGTLPAFAEELPPLVPYDLRHTYCTDLERAGVPLNVASRLMGHSSVEITARIYTHTSKDMFDDAASKLDALVSKTGDVIGDVKETRKYPQMGKPTRQKAIPHRSIINTKKHCQTGDKPI